MRNTHVDGRSNFISGSSWKECARCGWDTRKEDLKKDGETGALVCPDCYDPKHPLSEKRREA